MIRRRRERRKKWTKTGKWCVSNWKRKILNCFMTCDAINVYRRARSHTFSTLVGASVCTFSSSVCMTQECVAARDRHLIATRYCHSNVCTRQREKKNVFPFVVGDAMDANATWDLTSNRCCVRDVRLCVLLIEYWELRIFIVSFDVFKERRMQIGMLIHISMQTLVARLPYIIWYRWRCWRWHKIHRKCLCWLPRSTPSAAIQIGRTQEKSFFDDNVRRWRKCLSPSDLCHLNFSARKE